jgi:peptidyl-prolyl cis-trans isomerase C
MKRFTTALLLLFATLLHADDKMTPLDKAYETALKDQTKAGEFYNLFLRSDIFIPTFDVPDREGARRADGQEAFNPVIIEKDGRKTLILFDTLERLKGYATREIGYVSMPGHAILESMPDGFHWAMNHTTDHYKEFSPEEIAHLKKQIEAARPKPTTVKEGTQIMIGAPAKIPEGLIDALRETLKRNGEVTTARLGQVYIAAEGEVPHLALVVRTGGITDTVKQAMIKDLSTACSGKLGKGDHIDILIDEPGQISEGIISEVEPFHKKR